MARRVRLEAAARGGAPPYDVGTVLTVRLLSVDVQSALFGPATAVYLAEVVRTPKAEPESKEQK